MSASPALFEFEGSAGVATKDALFLERLDTFMEKCLADIKAFAERELQPYEETRRCIAQWHANYLFQPSATPPSSSSTSLPVKNAPDRSSQVRAVLCDASRILESLSETSGVQSFLLAVDPHEPSDGGFLGGSLLGREFWRGLRGGGENGARSFRTHCTAHSQAKNAGRNIPQPQNLDRQLSTPPPKGGPAKSIKNELYESVRTALRRTSRIRSAEMKWTNPERLDVFGVRLVGWPEGVPSQNPSSLKVSQNRLLLDAIQNGSMRFERISLTRPGGSDDMGEVEEASRFDDTDLNDDFSWAYDADARPPEQCSTVTPSPPFSNALSINQIMPTTSLDESDLEHNSWGMDPVVVDDTTYAVDYSWDGEFPEHTTTTLQDEWNTLSQSQLERPRKRPRSEEPSSEMNHDQDL